MKEKRKNDPIEKDTSLAMITNDFEKIITTTTDEQSNRVTCKTEATVAVDGVSCFQAQC